MKCPSCQSELRESAAYCANCGAPAGATLGGLRAALANVLQKTLADGVCGLEILEASQKRFDKGEISLDELQAVCDGKVNLSDSPYEKLGITLETMTSMAVAFTADLKIPAPPPTVIMSLRSLDDLVDYAVRHVIAKQREQHPQNSEDKKADVPTKSSSSQDLNPAVRGLLLFLAFGAAIFFMALMHAATVTP